MLDQFPDVHLSSNQQSGAVFFTMLCYCCQVGLGPSDAAWQDYMDDMSG